MIKPCHRSIFIAVFLGLLIPVLSFACNNDGGMLVPERKDVRFIIFKGSTDVSSTDWTKPKNILWSINFRNVKGHKDLMQYLNIKLNND